MIFSVVDPFHHCFWSSILIIYCFLFFIFTVYIYVIREIIIKYV